MRTINAPKEITRLDIACGMDRTAALCLWLALKSGGTVMDIGCGEGARVCAWAIMLLRFKRRIIALDWSQEHRVSPKQRRTLARFDIGRKCRSKDGVEVVDVDPSLVPVDQFQPLGFSLIDYDYSLEALRRVSEPVLASAPVLASPNVVVAWAGFREPKPEEPNEVRNYVGSLDVGDTYHFNGSQLAFKVFNANPAFREELRALSRL